MTAYQNWRAICLLEPKNIPLMQALALANPGDALEARLIQAFPEFFCEAPVRAPVPLSVLERAAAELSGLPESGSEGGAGWQGACCEFDIPIVGCWRADGDYVMQDPVITTRELKDLVTQLREKPCRSGEIVNWRGQRCMVAGISVTPVVDGSARLEALYLVPAECVAPDC